MYSFCVSWDIVTGNESEEKPKILKSHQNRNYLLVVFIGLEVKGNFPCGAQMAKQIFNCKSINMKQAFVNNRKQTWLNIGNLHTCASHFQVQVKALTRCIVFMDFNVVI